MKKSILSCVITLTLSCSLGLAGCATNKSPTDKPSGFLPDYKLLQPVQNPPQGTQIYTYTNPNVKRSDYQQVMVAPVLLYQTATENGITQSQIEAARTNIQNGIKQIISQKATLTDSPGQGVATLTVAITGAQLEGDGFKPRDLIPVSAAINLASMATGLDSKKPVLVVELKFTDSVSGKLLRETLTTISGETFRNKANTSAEFEQLAQNWVSTALQYSATSH